MKLESVKTAIIAVLFATCLIMSGRIMMDLSSGNENNLNTKALSSVPGNVDVICPQDYVVSFGGGLHTGVFDEALQRQIWVDSVKLIRNASETGIYEPVTAGVWTTAVNNRGVLLRMPFDCDEEMLALLAEKELKSGAVESFNVIVMPTSEPGQFYLGNVSKGQYVRCTFRSEGTPLSEIVDQVENQPYAEFRSLEAVYSIKSILNPQNADNFAENDNVIPTLPLQNFRKLSLKNDAASGSVSAEDMRRMAANAFGSDLSFVKKISDVDGSVVYVYGYGEKSLKIGIDGRIEYKKSKPGSEKNRLAFAEALHRSLSALVAYGKLPENIYVVSYRDGISDQGVTQTFGFAYRMKGIPFILKQGSLQPPIEVTFTNGEITNLTKNMWHENGEIHSIEQEATPFVDMLDKNFKTLQKAGPARTAGETDSHYAYRLLNGIKRIELVYTLNTGGDVAIGEPVWRIDVGARSFLLDYFDGSMIENLPIEGGGR